MMQILIFILGITFGSFLNVCISRIPNKESIIFPSSHCPSCKTSIKPYDLIPILSYVLLSGRCRQCGHKISVQYPLVELITGIIFLFIFYKFGLTLQFVKYSIICCLLIIISFIDLKIQEIPNGLIIFGLIASVIFIFIEGYKASMISGGLGFLIGGGIFLLIAVLSNGAMGGGDIKLMAVLGLFLGWKYILMVSILSFIIGTIICIVLLLLKIKSRKDYVAFGPFIALAALIIIFYGNDILRIYAL